MAVIAVKHNMEMAHRLSQTEGKCQQIHGHSWWVTLEIKGEVDANGILLEFGDVKKKFRTFLDEFFDHRLLLNASDPILSVPGNENVPEWIDRRYPGAQFMDGDPTTEHVAQAIYHWARETWDLGGFEREGGPKYEFRITVWETSVNCAIVGDWE